MPMGKQASQIEASGLRRHPTISAANSSLVSFFPAPVCLVLLIESDSKQDKGWDSAPEQKVHRDSLFRRRQRRLRFGHFTPHPSPLPGGERERNYRGHVTQGGAARLPWADIFDPFRVAERWRALALSSAALRPWPSSRTRPEVPSATLRLVGAREVRGVRGRCENDISPRILVPKANTSEAARIRSVESGYWAASVDTEERPREGGPQYKS